MRISSTRDTLGIRGISSQPLAAVLFVLAWLFPRASLADPDLTGFTISKPASVVSYKDTIKFELCATNTGTTGEAGIHWAFPNYMSTWDVNEGAATDLSYDEWGAGDLIWHVDGYQFPATYTMAECWHLSWPAGAKRCCEVVLDAWSSDRRTLV